MASASIGAGVVRAESGLLLGVRISLGAILIQCTKHAPRFVRAVQFIRALLVVGKTIGTAGARSGGQIGEEAT